MCAVPCPIAVLHPLQVVELPPLPPGSVRQLPVNAPIVAVAVSAVPGTTRYVMVQRPVGGVAAGVFDPVTGEVGHKSIYLSAVFFNGPQEHCHTAFAEVAPNASSMTVFRCYRNRLQSVRAASPHRVPMMLDAACENVP